jgi:hypothetical protein
MVFMFASIPVIILFSLLIESAQAANFYVRPNGGTYGKTNGSNWDNAFNGFSGISWDSVSCGDTIWVAGGSYTQELKPKKKCTSGSRLYIRRARADASECTGAKGWASSFNDTVTQIRAPIYFYGDYDYITISGRTTASGGDYGWHINYKGATEAVGIMFENGYNYDYNTFEYMNLEGPGYVDYTGAGGRAIDISVSYSSPQSYGNTFSHMKIWDWESAIYNTEVDGTVFEYLDVYDITPKNWSDYHPNGIYILASDHGVVRYSKWHRGPNGFSVGEGIFFAGTGTFDDWKIYGNIFYDLASVGDKAIEVRGTVTGTNLLVYNNTFDNVTSPVMNEAGGCSTGSEFKNNILYKSPNTTCGTTSNNLVQSTPNPFVDQTNHNYHIVGRTGAGYPQNAGVNLSHYLTKDMDGITYGGDGAWDIGAYEWSSGASKIPAPPFDIQIR